MGNDSDLKVRSRLGASVTEFWRRYKKNRNAMIGLAILLLLVFVFAFADLIVPYEKALQQNYDAFMRAPTREYLFGTDHMGRDLFARVVHGSRNSLTIGIGSTVISLVLGGSLGAVAAYYGGVIDDIIMRIMDVFMCIPPILLSLAIVAALGANMLNLILAITLGGVPHGTRLMRSVLLTLSEQDFVEAARSYGCTDKRIIFKYIMPNAMGTIIIGATMNIAGTILSAAGLSFIGMGVRPPSPEWGSILSESKSFMRQAPYLVVFPGLAILLSALSFNLIGDGLRDAFDPKLKD